ncbi:hypothetical protein DRQ21_05360, partial [Candidatus Fermentibacteria bacterium]
TFYSYRDPSPADSLQIFKNAIQTGFEHIDLSPRSVEDSIIASVKGMDPAVRPSMANGLAILRQLKEISIGTITEHKAQLLSVNVPLIEQFAELLESRSSDSRICVVGNDSVLDSMGIEKRVKL